MKKGDKVLIIGYYGMANAGADIRLRVLVRDIKKANPNAEISVAAFRYNPVLKIKGVKYVFLNNVFTGVAEAIAKLPNYDYVICGEGIPFVDFCGVGFIDYFLPVLYFSHLFGKKTACYSFDVDHLTKFHEWLTLKILKNMDLLVARSKKTYDFLRRHKIRKNLYLGTDTSFLFNVKRRETKIKKIGFCFKDFYCYPVKFRLFGRREDCYHYPFYYTYGNNGKEKYKKFVKKMAEMINILMNEDKELFVDLIVLEHQMDYEVTRDIYKLIKDKQRVEIISRKIYDLEYIKSNFSGLRCLIAARYHSLLQALEYKVPTLVLSTDERFDYFIEELGLQRFLISVYKENIDTKKIMEFIKKCSSFKPMFSEKVEKQYPALKEKAKNNYKFLKKLFEKS